MEIKSQEIQGDENQELSSESTRSLRPAEADGVAGQPPTCPVWLTCVMDAESPCSVRLTFASEEDAHAYRSGLIRESVSPVNYQRRLYDECITAGWDAGKQNSFAEEIAHLHEELSEAFREWRRHKNFEIRYAENGKPEGIPIELADVLIGLFYNAELHGFDLFAAVEEKHRYNLTRNYVAEGRQLHTTHQDREAATT